MDKKSSMLFTVIAVVEVYNNTNCMCSYRPKSIVTSPHRSVAHYFPPTAHLQVFYSFRNECVTAPLMWKWLKQEQNLKERKKQKNTHAPIFMSFELTDALFRREIIHLHVFIISCHGQQRVLQRDNTLIHVDPTTPFSTCEQFSLPFYCKSYFTKIQIGQIHLNPRCWQSLDNYSTVQCMNCVSCFFLNK